MGGSTPAADSKRPTRMASNGPERRAPTLVLCRAYKGGGRSLGIVVCTGQIFAGNKAMLEGVGGRGGLCLAMTEQSSQSDLLPHKFRRIGL